MADRSYQVIARKWRPQRFAEVVGQQAVVRTLSNALSQRRVAHAYCFSGIRGVGKTTVARLLAKGLNCRAADGPTAEPCGECESCREIMDGRSMDVIERDAASDRGINEMKELIEIARYSPSRDRYKVFILDEAHMLTPEASNALLKVLEEPPAWIVFMLATTEPNKILPTILSRCQHYQLGRISQREIHDQLGKIAGAEGVEVSEDGLALLATAADGSLRDGQSLLDKLIAFSGERIDEQTVVDLLGLVDRVLLFRVTDLIADGDTAGTIRFVDEMVDSGVNLHQFTVDLLGHLRNLLVVRTVEDSGSILHLPDADVERLRQQADSFTVDDLDRAFSLVAGSEYRIKSSEQPRYHLELVLARLARMPRLEPIEELLAAVRGEHGGGTPGPAGGGGGGRGRAMEPSRVSARSPVGSTARSATSSSPSPAPAAATTPAPASPPRGSERLDAPAVAGSPDAPGSSDVLSPPDAPGTPEVPDAPHVPDAPGPPDEPEPPEQPQPSELPEPDEQPELPRPPERPRLVPAASEAEPGGSAEVEPAREPPRPDLPQPGLLRKIQEQVNVTHPLIAQILGRSSGISLAGEKLIFQFPESAGIFVDRLRDPEMLRRLADAARTVTGRQVVARIETHAARPAARDAGAATTPERRPETAAAPSTPRADGPRLVTAPAPGEIPAPSDADDPGAERDGSAELSSSNGDPAIASNGAPPAPAKAEDPALRRRAEAEPLVQEFVKALRGQIVSVEELP